MNITTGSFGSSGTGNSMNPDNQCNLSTHPLSPQELKERARRSSDEAEALLTDMEYSAAQQVHNIRRSRVSSSPLPAGVIATTPAFAPGSLSSSPTAAAAAAAEMAAAVSAEVPIVPTTPGAPGTTPKVDSLTPPVPEAGTPFPNDLNTEAYHMHQLAKLREARMHVSDVRKRLATLEEEADFRSQEKDPVGVVKTRYGLPSQKNVTPDWSYEEEILGVTLGDLEHKSMNKESLETLRREAKIIKGHIKVNFFQFIII